MSKYDFFHSTPNDIDIFIHEYDSRRKSEIEVKAEELEYAAWINGVYVRLAVASALNGKKAKYPKKPLDRKDTPVNIEVTEDMSENEKEKVRKQFAENMKELFIRHSPTEDDS